MFTESQLGLDDFALLPKLLAGELRVPVMEN